MPSTVGCTHILGAILSIKRIIYRKFRALSEFKVNLRFYNGPSTQYRSLSDLHERIVQRRVEGRKIQIYGCRSGLIGTASTAIHTSPQAKPLSHRQIPEA